MSRRDRWMAGDRTIDVYQIVSTFYPSVGGTQRATGTLSRGSIRQGYGMEVLTAWHSGLSRHEVVDGVPVRRLGLGGSGKLRSLTFGLHTFFFVLLRARSVPLVHTQNVDTPLLVGVLLKLVVRKRWVATVHGEWHIPRLCQTSLGRLRLCLMYRLADRLIAISEETRRTMIEEGASPESISLIPNGLDTGFFRPPDLEERRAVRARYGYGPDDVVVIYVGRLVFRKRVDLLLSAFARLGQESAGKCAIVGGGSKLNDLKALAKGLGLDERVRFVGPVDNVRDFYWLGDVFVLPSQFEGLPVALLEGMACGMAVLVTECPGNLVVVTDGVNGLTSAVDDEDHLAQRLARLMGDAMLRRTLGEEARRTVLERYSMQAVSEAHLRVYAEVVEQARQDLAGYDELAAE
jgi:glycosyltransferase involved in cell wall biosynthesis